MPTPTTSLLLNSTNPPAPSGFQNVKPLSDGGGTPLVSVSFNVPNTGGVSVQTANYTAQETDCGMLLVFNSATALTLTLPAAIPFEQWNVDVTNIGVGTLSIASGSLTLDGLATSVSVPQYQSVSIATDGTNYFSARAIALPLSSIVGIVIDGGGAVPTTGAKGVIQVPFAGTITGWTMLADQTGGASITVSKGTYAAFPTVSSIVASLPPSITSARKNTSTTLTGWTTALSVGDVLSFNLDSVTTMQRISLELQVSR